MTTSTTGSAGRMLHGDDGMGGMTGGFSGSVGGHVVPGSFFAGFGLYLLILTAQRLFKSESVDDFCASHIPERNMKLLRRIGILAVVCTLLGILVEGMGGELFLGQEGHPFFQNLQHITLYTLFCVSGLAGILESLDILPKESFRACTAAAFFAESIIWNEHAQMKMNLVDQRIHVLVALTCLGSSSMMTISVFRPNQIVPFVGAFFFMTWQGLWLLAAAYNIQAANHFDLETMTSYFILEGVAMGCCVLVVVALLHRKFASERIVKEDDYARVQLTSMEDEEDEDVVDIPVSRQNGTHAKKTDLQVV